MHCVLCHTPRRPLTRVADDLWRMECPTCGTYCFTSAFGEFTKRARAARDVHAVRAFARLSGVLRHVSAPVTLTPSNYLGWAERRENALAAAG